MIRRPGRGSRSALGKPRSAKPICLLDVMRIDDRADQPRKALLNLGASRGVMHLDALTLAADQPCFPQRLEVLGER